ncbi:MAG: AAA family ATPase [Oscillospiraceae bacterium]|nr:AAA family ATPase [Oscillospiraceae bacterium]
MKTLYLIGGTMGVGKTTTCQILKRELPKAVFLDGDWCWDADPFVVTPETQSMVLGNIAYLLNSFLSCSEYENVIFCWVMHQQAIVDTVLTALHTEGVAVKSISLMCSAEALTERLRRDVEAGVRQEDVIARSLERIPLYGALNTVKVDVSSLTPEEAAKAIEKI